MKTLKFPSTINGRVAKNRAVGRSKVKELMQSQASCGGTQSTSLSNNQFVNEKAYSSNTVVKIATQAFLSIKMMTD
jgi:hypothetical protein